MTPAPATIPPREYKELQPGDRLSDAHSRRLALETERSLAEINSVGAAADVKAENARRVKDELDPELKVLDELIGKLETAAKA